MLKLMTLMLMALACACQAEPPRDASVAGGTTPGAAHTARPVAGALAMGSPEAQVTAALGASRAQWKADSFDWRRFEAAGVAIEAGFYRDKLGRIRLTPASPMPWAEALDWIRALAPGFDEAKLDKTKPEGWGYFETITVDGVPFEVGLQIQRQGDRVTAVHGEMNWLD